jgi:hypothetical protein
MTLPTARFARPAARITLALALAAGAPAGVALAQNDADRRAPAAAEQEAERLPITQLTLYRSGVGSFERRGLVEGDATVRLRFDADQINDILKSMVALDLDGGRIEGVSYGSREPLARRLASFGINIADNPSMAEVAVAAARGADPRAVARGRCAPGQRAGCGDARGGAGGHPR